VPAGGSDETQQDLDRLVEQRTKYALVGLRAIGAKVAANVLAKVCTGTGDCDLLERQFRDAENPPALLIGFARKHPKEFRPGPNWRE
jgi:hypothetical protein